MTAHPLRMTGHRRAFIRATAERGRIVRYVSTREAWDRKESRKVNERLDEAFLSGWVEPIPDEDLWPGAEPRTRVVYYRPTDAGWAEIGGRP